MPLPAHVRRQIRYRQLARKVRFIPNSEPKAPMQHDPIVIHDDHLNPDCRDGKHAACRGDAWCDIDDESASCDCSCHTETSAA